MIKLMSLAQKGFTLIELLVVIVIISVLALIVMLLINPLQIAKRTRDSNRLTDLANLQRAINVATLEATDSGNTTFCQNMPPPCSGDSYPSAGNARRPDGSGWVKVDLSGKRALSAPVLPIDPLNNETFHYSYSSDGKTWQIQATLEEGNKAISVGSK